MIETENLSKLFEDKVAVDRLSFRAEPGQVLGFLGPNGAGKSTTVKILTGMIRPTEGSAWVAGFDVLREPLEVKKRIGYTPESGALFEHLSPCEYLDLVGALHHLERDVIRRRSQEFFELFGLSEVQHQRMTEFSKGMKQKTLIASALISKPEVIFLDEPLNGLDANAAGIVKELLRGLAAQGKTVLFCSHILEVVERICDRIIIIENGKIAAEGSTESIAAASGSRSLDEAFRKLTGVREANEVASEFLAALEQS